MGEIKGHVYNKVTPIESIYDIIRIAKDEAADSIAIKHKLNKEVHSVTYSQLYDDVVSLYCALKADGYDKEHIGCIGENSYAWVNVFLSALISDGVFVPADKELPADDIVTVFTHSDSKIVFCSAKHEKILKEKRADMPQVEKFICFEREEDEGEFLSFNKYLEKGKEIYKKGEYTLPDNGREKNKLKLLVYTSGTTGKAKGVMLSEKNIASIVYHGLRVSTIYDTCLSVLPYHHTYGAVCDVLVSFHKHSTLCINDSLKAVLPNLQLYKPTHIMLVPMFVETFYNRIQKTLQETGKANLVNTMIKISNALRKVGIDLRRVLFKSILEKFGGRLRKMVCGGAPVRAEVGYFFDSIGVIIGNGYGITECSPLVSTNRDCDNDPATVGYILPCIEVEIREKNEEGIGEICVQGDTVMLGYYKNEEATKEALTTDGWFNTGDYGYFNKKGQLVISGRKKNLIVLNNGKNVYPEEIEDYITGIPEILEAVVYSPKDENGEQKQLCAKVFLETPLSVDEVKKKINEVLKPLPVYKQIREVIIMEEEFEKTTTKKIKRSLYTE